MQAKAYKYELYRCLATAMCIKSLTFWPLLFTLKENLIHSHNMYVITKITIIRLFLDKGFLISFNLPSRQ